MARLLLIEDDHHMANVLRECLEADGHSVETAYEAADGLRRALNEPPDLILLDVMLPDATGFQTVHQFRQAPATALVPIIMMSGAATNQSQQRLGGMMGADDYMVKPIDAEALQKKIKRLLVSPRVEKMIPDLPPAAGTPVTTLYSSPAVRTSSGPATIAVLEIPAKQLETPKPITTIWPDLSVTKEYPRAQPVRPVVSPAAPAATPIPAPRTVSTAPQQSLKLTVTLLLLHAGLTVMRGLQESAPTTVVALSLSKTCQFWAALVGLIILSAGVFHVSLDARAALRMVGWVGMPLVLKAFLQVLGLNSAHSFLNLQWFWPISVDAFSVAALSIIAARLRWQPNGSLLKSICMLAALLFAWSITFPSGA